MMPLVLFWPGVYPTDCHSAMPAGYPAVYVPHNELTVNMNQGL